MRKDIENIKFGRRVVELRHVVGLTQEALAYKSEINRTYLGEIERGEKTPSLSIIIKISKGLGLTKNKLLDYE